MRGETSREHLRNSAWKFLRLKLRWKRYFCGFFCVRKCADTGLLETIKLSDDHHSRTFRRQKNRATTAQSSSAPARLSDQKKHPHPLPPRSHLLRARHTL